MRADRVLIIDDILEICQLISAVAVKAGYMVETACNGADFKASYESFQPTVIVLDLLIPDEDGIELLWYLHRKNYSGAIIIVSGAPKTILMAAQTMARGLRLHVAEIFCKPFRVQKLTDTLTRLRSAPTRRTG